MFVGAFFRPRNIHTLHSPVYLCISCWPLDCFGVLLYLWASFWERGVLTHLFCLFICVRVIISVHGLFTPVTVRHEQSRIVTVRANLATRLGSSRSINFFRGRCTLPEVHFCYPFSRHDIWCDNRDSRQRFVTGLNYPESCHDPSRSVTPFATRYGSGVLDMKEDQCITERALPTWKDSQKDFVIWILNNWWTFATRSVSKSCIECFFNCMVPGVGTVLSRATHKKSPSWSFRTSKFTPTKKNQKCQIKSASF